ncbi:uncharacterized protein LOC143885879 [Tasmannia lanceolata]|uniref:uncharacterized protein LOC143885879 n=1 Tax=Tasmannia lanceolata TaxID=3420 RepID=UPI0040637F08
MKTFFIAQELWELVENGFVEIATDVRELRKKDAKVLLVLQQAVAGSIFPRIVGATSSKQAWTILRQEFHGDSKVTVVKLQTLRRDFETLFMKGSESVQDFFSRISVIINQMKTFGENVSYQKVVEIFLRSLPNKFDHVVTGIEKSKDLSIFSLNELMGSLLAHEERMNRSTEKNLEHAFQSKVEISSKEKNGDGSSSQRQAERGRGRGGYRGRGRGRGRTDMGHQRHENGEKSSQRQNYKGKQCYFVRTMGISKQIAGKKQSSKPTLLKKMKRKKDLFRTIDKSVQLQVRPGDGNVGQLIQKGYLVLFHDDVCEIKSRKSEKFIIKIHMAENKMFPLELSCLDDCALVANVNNDSRLWHLRYGHLHFNGMKLLSHKSMVAGLPSIICVHSVCESCVYGKQHRLPFPVGKAWRAKMPLELVHADICGPMTTLSLNKSKYLLLFTDDFTRMSWVFFLVQKSEAFENFKEFKALQRSKVAV